LHLEGNAFVYQNFYEVCLTRGVLKLDFVANLMCFTCLFFILLYNDVEEDLMVWLAIVGLFIITVMADIFGGCATVLSARKRMYVGFIFFRSIVEMAKILILVLLWFYEVYLW
jgi:hypothetical protein